MTWRDLKRLIEAAGVRDTDEIAYVDIGETAIRSLHTAHSTAQDPDGIQICIQRECNGTRTVSIS